MLVLTVISLLTGCSHRAKDSTMSETQLMTEIEEVLGKFDAVLVKNRCVAEYAQLRLQGGCYLSRAQSEEIAKDVAQALVKAGFEPYRLLRLDFGVWSTTLHKGKTDVAFSVEPLALDLGQKYAADQQAGYRSKLTLSLSATEK